MGAKTKCGKCGRAITDDERLLGWPVTALDGADICPACYGDEAYCGDCGELLRGDEEHGPCPHCNSREYYALEAARHPSTEVAADRLRHIIASRRDGLVAAQRRSYSHRRAALIDRLAEDYDRVLAIAEAAR